MNKAESMVRTANCVTRAEISDSTASNLRMRGTRFRQRQSCSYLSWAPEFTFILLTPALQLLADSPVTRHRNAVYNPAGVIDGCLHLVDRRGCAGPEPRPRQTRPELQGGGLHNHVEFSEPRTALASVFFSLHGIKLEILMTLRYRFSSGST